MGERIFCPGCGVPIDEPGRSCPSCQEPLPAPKTFVGFGDLPADGIDESKPATQDTAPEPDTEPEPPLEATWNSFGTAAPVEVKAQATFPGHPGPSTAAGAVIAGAPEVAVPPASELANSKMAVSVREPPMIEEAALAGPNLGGSTTPGFPNAPAVPRNEILQLDPSAQVPAAGAHPAAVAHPSAPLPEAAASPPQAQPAPAFIAPQPQAYAAPQPQQAQPAPAYAAPQPQQAQPAPAYAPQPQQAQPQAPTAPHEGPPAAAFNPPPQQVQPHAAGQQPFVYGQPTAPVAAAPPSPAEPVPAEAATGTEATELAPTDTRAGLVWRTVAGGALLTWTLLFGLTSCVFIAVHLVLFLKYGLGNVHANTFTTFGVAAGALIPTVLLTLASVSCLSGRGWPRATAGAAALTHVVWSGVTLFVLSQTFVLDDSAKAGAYACAFSALITIFGFVLLLVGGRWVGKTQPGKPARAVPYPLWAGPLLIVLGSLSIVRETISIVQVIAKAAQGSRLEYSAEKFYESYPLFWAGAAGLLLSIVLVVAGIALLRRTRWAVGLGGVAGLLVLVADVVAILVLYIGDDIREHGGPLFGVVDMYTLLAYGITAWFAVGGAFRFGFRLPRYLRDVPDKGADGKRLKLLDALVPARTQPAQHN